MYTACMDTLKRQLSASDACLSIRQVSERTGLSAYTLRYYEQEGLLNPIGRDSGGRRRYTSDDMVWIALLILLRDTEMPLAQIRMFETLMQQGPDAALQRRALIEAHRAQVQAQVDALCESLAMIDQKLAMMRRVERNPEELAGWRENCLDMLQKRNAERAQSVMPVAEANAKARMKRLRRR